MEGWRVVGTLIKKAMENFDQAVGVYMCFFMFKLRNLEQNYV